MSDETHEIMRGVAAQGNEYDVREWLNSAADELEEKTERLEAQDEEIERLRQQVAELEAGLVLPEGYALVPMEPTRQMLLAQIAEPLRDLVTGHEAEEEVLGYELEKYHSMLAAAPRHGADDNFSEPINIVFDGPPGPVAGRFIEVETDEGFSVRVGEWVKRSDGWWSLRIESLPTTKEKRDEHGNKQDTV